MAHHHHHHHHHHHDISGSTMRLSISIFLNILITLAQVGAGILSDSLSLLSDAVHNFSDVFALILSLVAQLLARRGFSAKQTFGYKRVEIIAALINGVSLVVISVFVCKEALMRFANPHHVETQIVMIFSALGIFINLFSALIIRKDAEHSLNMRSAYLHLMFDTLASVGVFFGALLMEWTGAFWIDSVLSIVISIFIAYSTWDLIWATIRVLMQFSPDHLDIKALSAQVLENKAIANIHHLHLWQLNDREVHLEAHLDFAEDLKLSQVSQHIDDLSKRLNAKFGITHAVFQPEYRTTHPTTLVGEDACEHGHS